MDNRYRPDELYEDWEQLWDIVHPHGLDPGVLGEYALLRRRHGKYEADRRLPVASAHLSGGCNKCAAALEELDVLLSVEYISVLNEEDQMLSVPERHVDGVRPDDWSRLWSIVAPNRLNSHVDPGTLGEYAVVWQRDPATAQQMFPVASTHLRQGDHGTPCLRCQVDLQELFETSSVEYSSIDTVQTERFNLSSILIRLSRNIYMQAAIIIYGIFLAALVSAISSSIPILVLSLSVVFIIVSLTSFGLLYGSVKIVTFTVSIAVSLTIFSISVNGISSMLTSFERGIERVVPEITTRPIEAIATPASPTPAKLALDAAEAALAARDFPRAIDILRTLKQTQPGTPGLDDLLYRAHNDYGAMLLAQGDLDKSDAEFREALALRPGEPVALDGQKQVLLARSWRDVETVWEKDQEAAIPALETILKIDPNYRDARLRLYAALVTRAHRLLAVGDRKESRLALEQAIQLAPERPEARQLLSAVDSSTPSTPVAAVPSLVSTPIVAQVPPSTATSLPSVGTGLPVPDTGWMVQIGAFSNRELAENMAADARRRGFALVALTPSNSLITNSNAPQGLFLVYIGPFASRAEGERQLANAHSNGYPNAFLREIIGQR